MIVYDDEEGEPFPAVLHVCRRSREEAVKVYTQLSTTMPYRRRSNRRYINTLYDTFYLGGYEYEEFKVLIDLVVKANTTRQLLPEVQDDLERLQNIRLLTVDLTVFSAVPAKLWAHFSKLEKFSIAFYPSDMRADTVLIPSSTYDLELVRPQRGTKFGNRARWLVSIIKKALESAAKDVTPHWTVPRIEAVLLMTCRAFDDDVEMEYKDEDTDIEYECSDDEREDTERETKWRGQITAQITHTVSEHQINLWKRKYLPGRRAGTVELEAGEAIEDGSYYMGSKTEGGGFASDSDE